MEEELVPTSDVLPVLVIAHVLYKLVCSVPLTDVDLYAIQAMPSEEIDKHDWLMVLAGAEMPSEELEKLAREELSYELLTITQPHGDDIDEHINNLS